jgi:hypothetical protein
MPHRLAGIVALLAGLDASVLGGCITVLGFP